MRCITPRLRNGRRDCPTQDRRIQIPPEGLHLLDLCRYDTTDGQTAGLRQPIHQQLLRPHFGTTEPGPQQHASASPVPFHPDAARHHPDRDVEPLYLQRVKDFEKKLDNPYLVLSNRPTNIDADSLAMLDSRYAEILRQNPRAGSCK